MSLNSFLISLGLILSFLIGNSLLIGHMNDMIETYDDLRQNNYYKILYIFIYGCLHIIGVLIGSLYLFCWFGVIIKNPSEANIKKHIFSYVSKWKKRPLTFLLVTIIGILSLPTSWKIIFNYIIKF